MPRMPHMDNHRSPGVLDAVLLEIAAARHYNDWLFAGAKPYLGQLADDGQALRRFRGHLRPGGHALLLVPAHPLLYGDFDRAAGHVRRYGRSPLRALLDGRGSSLSDFGTSTCSARLAGSHAFNSVGVANRRQHPFERSTGSCPH